VNRLNDQNPHNRFVILFVSLVFVFMLVPVWLFIFPDTNQSVLSLMIEIPLLITLVSATYAVSNNRKLFYIGAVLGCSSLITNVVTMIQAGDAIYAVSLVVNMIFFAFIITQGLRHLFQVQIVTVDTIAASLCVYILMALLWASFYTLQELHHPGSFKLPDSYRNGSEEFTDAASSIATYYSLVTITTLGYGDITPVSQVARSSSSFQAVIGQLYLVVLVARLVGIYSANGQGSQEKSDD
jgi:Ion channel